MKSYLSLNYFKILLLVTILTFFDYMMLTNIDQLMSNYVIGYKARSSYFVSNNMYFISCFITITFGVMHGWSRMLPFIYIAVSIFFPLIFLNTYWEFRSEISTELEGDYREIFCKIKNYNSDLLCGEALAYISVHDNFSLIKQPGLAVFQS